MLCLAVMLATSSHLLVAARWSTSCYCSLQDWGAAQGLALWPEDGNLGTGATDARQPDCSSAAARGVELARAKMRPYWGSNPGPQDIIPDQIG